MRKLQGIVGRIYNIFGMGGRFLLLIPSGLFGAIRFFVWPKDSRRRYRTALFAVFLIAIFAFLIDYPIYWNRFADFANPKIDSIDMPDNVRKLDKWGVLGQIDKYANIPHFWNIPFSQGLDLQGGISLLYQADLSKISSSDRKEAMNGLRDVIERRVNTFGVREPKVTVLEADREYRLSVELAGIEDFNEAIKMIGATPYLEFKEERPPEEQNKLLRQLFQEGVFEADIELTDAYLESICKNINPQFLFILQSSGKEDPCFESAGLTGRYLKEASVQFDQNTNLPSVGLQFDDAGSKLFEEMTGRNIGKQIPIFLDDMLRSYPRVQEKISGGKAQITGVGLEEAKQIARDLNAGALPVPISLISQKSIGAELGRESLEESLRAGLFGIIAVMFFMVILYRLSGLLAVVSLLIYLALFLAAIKLIPVTLTLPGIAGLILSIGMAVDANILVFERLREEFSGKDKESGGKDFVFRMNRAYERAWSSIRDGNISTLLTCVILFWFSTSFIKGFALTLGLGIAISMFSAMVVTKYLMKFFGEGRLGGKVKIWNR